MSTLGTSTTCVMATRSRSGFEATGSTAGLIAMEPTLPRNTV